ncbi:DUF2199 domain-containing protein [Pseudoduganella sp. FT55W]|uniref:DUF2199 domain-containing protein n=1 Tax=Duganella rivi TaxID=2666083 RepID=A0A7X4GM75_9BURK|nr:DUF2199 domain-containing protein [Duganella rivi]MYM66043.1 DUF2199 domain-containing protein [Duganella rivi]
MTFEFSCASCGEIHRGMPGFGARAPLSYYLIPAEERDARCSLGSDDCVIDEEFFFIHGCVEIPVHGEEEPFSWGVWVSLSKKSFTQWAACYDEKERAHIGPFFGWLNAALRPYPETAGLKTQVYLRNDGIRPYIEIEPIDHPLAVEQREGISVARVAEIYAQIMHEKN